MCNQKKAQVEDEPLPFHSKQNLMQAKRYMQHVFLHHGCLSRDI